jgi:hypothetical protein
MIYLDCFQTLIWNSFLVVLDAIQRNGKTCSLQTIFPSSKISFLILEECCIWISTSLQRCGWQQLSNQKNVRRIFENELPDSDIRQFPDQYALTFHPFHRAPKEIRRMIWQYAMSTESHLKDLYQTYEETAIHITLQFVSRESGEEVLHRREVVSLSPTPQVPRPLDDLPRYCPPQDARLNAAPYLARPKIDTFLIVLPTWNSLIPPCAVKDDCYTCENGYVWDPFAKSRGFEHYATSRVVERSISSLQASDQRCTQIAHQGTRAI